MMIKHIRDIWQVKNSNITKKNRIYDNSFRTPSLSRFIVGKSDVVAQQQQRGHAGQRASRLSLQNHEHDPGFQRRTCVEAEKQCWALYGWRSVSLACLKNTYNKEKCVSIFISLNVPITVKNIYIKNMAHV